MEPRKVGAHGRAWSRVRGGISGKLRNAVNWSSPLRVQSPGGPGPAGLALPLSLGLGRAGPGALRRPCPAPLSRGLRPLPVSLSLPLPSPQRRSVRGLLGWLSTRTRDSVTGAAVAADPSSAVGPTGRRPLWMVVDRRFEKENSSVCELPAPALARCSPDRPRADAGAGFSPPLCPRTSVCPGRAPASSLASSARVFDFV